jgi:protein-S-isoprenylcysteine O-methyltransferase Ste14
MKKTTRTPGSRRGLRSVDEVMEVTTQQMNLIAMIGIVACWGAFALAWLAGAIFYEPGAPAERVRVGWLGTAASTGLVISLVAAQAVPRADWRSLALHAPAVRIPGLALLLGGTAFAIWARLALGAMWSATPTVKEEHRLRTGGPYAITRHPIYTGMLSMLLGSALLVGAGRWIVSFPVFLVLLQFKIRTEERLMLAEFPNDYPRYRQRVPQLVPGLRLVSGRTLASS